MSRRGVALLVALGVINLLGVIVATAFALARAEAAAGLGELAEVQARGGAEAAMVQALLGWPASLTPTITGGQSVIASLTLPGQVRGSAVVRALGGPIYSVRAQGTRVDLSGKAIALTEIEILIGIDSIGSGGLVHPRKYARGWRLLP